MEEAKKNLLTYAGLRKLEDELHDLKVVKRKEVAGKIKEAREQGDLSENAEYDAAKDEQRDIEARIEEIEKILKMIAEMEEYERDVLYPLATEQVEIDLDEGVKVNYPKLGAALKKIVGLDAKED